MAPRVGTKETGLYLVGLVDLDGNILLSLRGLPLGMSRGDREPCVGARVGLN